MKTFKLSATRLFFKTIFILIIIFITFAFPVLMTFGFLKMLSDNAMLAYVVGSGALVFSIYMFYYHFKVVKLFYQYYLHARNKKILIDFNNQKVILLTKNREVVLDEKNVTSIESNISTKDSKNLISEYEFVKFITIDNKEYIFTNFLIDNSIFIDILPNVKRVIKFNEINYLK